MYTILFLVNVFVEQIPRSGTADFKRNVLFKFLWTLPHDDPPNDTDLYSHPVMAFFSHSFMKNFPQHPQFNGMRTTVKERFKVIFKNLDLVDMER